MEISYSYKITNELNGRFYVGVHKCRKTIDIFGDRYFGSGKVIRQAVKAYGIENFTKDILYIFGSYDEALQWEADTITEDFILSNALCYNVKPGGLGGSGFCSAQTKQKMRKAKLGTKQSIDHKKNISQSKLGILKSEKTRQKMKEAKTGENHPMYGRKHSEETKQKMRLVRLSWAAAQ